MVLNEDTKSVTTDTVPAAAPAASPSTKTATLKTLPGTHTPGTAEVNTAEDKSNSEVGETDVIETIELVALVTRPMPDPVRSGTIFTAPLPLARHYIAQGWAVESKLEPAPESEHEK